MTKTTITSLSVIFLDIDGVLLPFGGDKNDDEDDEAEKALEEKSQSLFPDRTLAALNSIVKHVPNAVIVLSSTWRVRKDYCRQILDAFQEYNNSNNMNAKLVAAACLPDEFYDVTNVETHSERQWEIHDWLLSYYQQKDDNNNNNVMMTPIQAWVALDDEELLEGEKNETYRPEFEGHVVKTTSSTGLTKADAETAIRLLKQQQRKRRNL